MQVFVLDETGSRSPRAGWRGRGSCSSRVGRRSSGRYPFTIILKDRDDAPPSTSTGSRSIRARRRPACDRPGGDGQGRRRGRDRAPGPGDQGVPRGRGRPSVEAAGRARRATASRGSTTGRDGRDGSRRRWRAASPTCSPGSLACAGSARSPRRRRSWSSSTSRKSENPEISGIEYQQGTLAGYELREYLLEKYGSARAPTATRPTCRSRSSTSSPEPGRDRPRLNLTLACEPATAARATGRSRTS